jgi:hypothetical protein
MFLSPRLSTSEFAPRVGQHIVKYTSERNGRAVDTAAASAAAPSDKDRAGERREGHYEMKHRSSSPDEATFPLNFIALLRLRLLLLGLTGEGERVDWVRDVLWI